MKIAIRRGHQYTGEDGAAEGIVREIEVAKRYYKLVIQKLKDLGFDVLDVTPGEANRTLSDSLYYGVNKANEWNADLFISCHVNNCYDSYEGPLGCEVIYHPNSSNGKDYAIKVEKELSNLGFKSRGAKVDERGLLEPRCTNMPAIIIEPFFVESMSDISIYHMVGDEGIARAIVKGITENRYSGCVNTVNKYLKYEESIPQSEKIFSISNTKFYIEEAVDGRMLIHMDRGNYIAVGKGFIDLYWNDNNGKSGCKRLTE